MLLKRELLERIQAGEVDVIYRRWSRPTVRPGGTLKTWLGVLHIRKMEESSPEAVTDADAKRAGFADAADFRRWLATMKDGTVFHRMEVGFDGD
jgi:hypothetical protein